MLEVGFLQLRELISMEICKAPTRGSNRWLDMTHKVYRDGECYL